MRGMYSANMPVARTSHEASVSVDRQAPPQETPTVTPSASTQIE
jgi:hypothetical protein